MQTLIFSLPSLNNYLNIYNYKIYIVGSKHKNSCMMSKNHNPSKSLNFLLNLNPSSDSSTQRKINLENKRSTQSFLSIDQKKKPFSPDYEKLRFSPKHKNPFQKRIYKKVDRHNTGILFETQKFKDILKTKNNFNDEEKKSSKRFYAKSIRPFSSMNDKNEEIPINSQKKISKLDQNTLKYINSPQNCLPNDSILKNDKKLDYPKKIDLFYSTTMLCHIFQSSLKEKERDRLSLFLTNDWINKVLLDRKVEDVKNSEFIQPLSQRQIIQRKMEENKRIRKHFKSEIIKAKQNNNFLIPQKSLEKFRKTILLPNKIENQLDSEEMHSKVKLYGERDKDFHEEMEILKKLKKNEKKKKFVYHRIKKFKLEEIRASVLDYVSFLKELEELHGNANFKDCIPDKPYHNVGSYLFLKLVKRNKLEDVKKMLEENNFLIYEFDEVMLRIN